MMTIVHIDIEKLYLNEDNIIAHSWLFIDWLASIINSVPFESYHEKAMKIVNFL